MATTPLTGSASDPTTSPSASGPTAGDPAASSVIRAAFQAFLDYIAWLRGHVALLTGATFTGAVNGVTPTAPAHLTRKDYVDSGDAATLASANTHSDALLRPLCTGLYNSSGVLLAQSNDGVHVLANARGLNTGAWWVDLAGITSNAIASVSLRGSGSPGSISCAANTGQAGDNGHNILVVTDNTSGSAANLDFVITIWKL